MKIIKLSAQNVKRLSAVEITPDGNVVVIGGKNGAGKSSVLDAITYALGGKGTHCRKPVRDGEEKATIVCELGDLIVKRTITAEGGGTLTVENKDGARYPSPQAVLDKMTGELCFDPLEFSRKRPDDQAGTLRTLVGLDLSELDAERRALYTERTAVNREGKALVARVDGMPAHHDDAPESEIVTADLLAELTDAQGHNAEQAGLSTAVVSAERRLNEWGHDLAGANQAVRDIEEQLAQARADVHEREAQRDQVEVRVDDATKALTAFELIDEDAIRTKIDGADDRNRLLRENVTRAKSEAELEAARGETKRLSIAITGVDDRKKAAIAAAEFPVEGLGFDAEGYLTHNGVPFDQASSAEQLRVSVAMGIALNPDLRVLLVRDGSLLDDESLAMVAAMADENDAQVWIERVEDDEHVGVWIEDGAVAQVEAAAS